MKQILQLIDKKLCSPETVKNVIKQYAKILIANDNMNRQVDPSATASTSQSTKRPATSTETPTHLAEKETKPKHVVPGPGLPNPRPSPQKPEQKLCSPETIKNVKQYTKRLSADSNTIRQLDPSATASTRQRKNVV